MGKSFLVLVGATVTAAQTTVNVSLTWLGTSPTTPLKACTGDCDKDADCAGASKCIQRTGGNPAAVAGCTVGDSGAAGRGDTDYCTNPVAWTNALAWLGTSPTLPLKACQGDCDKDADCAGASKCLQRTGGNPAAVVGCTVGDSGGTGRGDTDYCTNPTWTNALEWLGNSPTTPLKACQGDCDKDADCTGASKCIQRTGGNPVAVAGCTVGDSGATARADDDYCTNPVTTAVAWTNALAWLGTSPTLPLKACQGDCDKDADCAGASKCIQRTGGNPAAVAGCTVGDSGGTGRGDTDYCTNPVAWTNALAWLGNSPTTPLKACQGDCDKDADCAGASKCIERTGGKPAAVAGCTVGDSGATARADDDYCTNPTWTNALEWLGNSPATPLKACQGDCDKDSDCAGNSTCIQRTGGKPAVAGCTVGDSGAAARADDDYCTNIVVATTVAGGSSSAAGLHAWPVVTGTAVALAISVTQ